MSSRDLAVIVGFAFAVGAPLVDPTARAACPTPIHGNWRIKGNCGTKASKHFLGTTDDQPLVVKTNGTERLRIETDGTVGIGTNDPLHLLQIGGGADGNLGFDGSDGTPHAGFIRFGDNTGWNLYVGRQRESSGGPLNTGTTGALVTFSDKGNVSIGTASGCFDGALLDVSTASGVGCVTSAIRGGSKDDVGVSGVSFSNYGVYGLSFGGVGVNGFSDSNTAVRGESNSGTYIFEGFAGGLRRFAVERATGNVLADGSYSGPADFAEMMPVDGSKDDYAVGDVLVIAPDGRLTRSDKPNASNLAGVYSGKPGFLGDTEIGAHGIAPDDSREAQQRVPVAIVGIVPVKVMDENGPIRPGDLLTSSSTPGEAMKAKPVLMSGIEIYAPGTILGKALESWGQGAGVVQALVTLR